MYGIRKAIYWNPASCIAAWNIFNVLRCISLLFSSLSCCICHSRAKMACSSFFLSSGICTYNPIKIPSFLVLFAILAGIRIPELNRASCRPDAERIIFLYNFFADYLLVFLHQQNGNLTAHNFHHYLFCQVCIDLLELFRHIR